MKKRFFCLLLCLIIVSGCTLYGTSEEEPAET